jgi:hypothetical protein
MTIVSLMKLRTWGFMWIDRKVYDFMLKLRWTQQGNLEYGTPEMLNLLGFTFLERRETLLITILRDIIKNGKRRFWSVFRWSLLTLENKYIHHFGKCNR